MKTDEKPKTPEELEKRFLEHMDEIDRDYKKQIRFTNIVIFIVKAFIIIVWGYLFLILVRGIYEVIKIQF